MRTGKHVSKVRGLGYLILTHRANSLVHSLFASPQGRWYDWKLEQGLHPAPNTHQIVAQCARRVMCVMLATVAMEIVDSSGSAALHPPLDEFKLVATATGTKSRMTLEP